MWWVLWRAFVIAAGSVAAAGDSLVVGLLGWLSLWEYIVGPFGPLGFVKVLVGFPSGRLSIGSGLVLRRFLMFVRRGWSLALLEFLLGSLVPALMLSL